MLQEYAVDPVAIAADWNTFRYVFDKFGSDKGRLVSRLPAKWDKKVKESAKNAGFPDVKFKSLIERLNQSKHRVVNFGRTYEAGENWLENIRREHAERPFHAIVCTDDTLPCSLSPDECSDDHDLVHCPVSRTIPRTADAIADILLPFAWTSRCIDIVDPFFDLTSRPERNDYLSPLRQLLGKLVTAREARRVIRVHHGNRDQNPPPRLNAEWALRCFSDGLRAQVVLEFHAWEELPAGEDLHDRFLLTEIGGLQVGAGFAASGSHQTANISLLDFNHAQELRRRFDREATTYSLAGACRLHPDATIENLLS